MIKPKPGNKKKNTTLLIRTLNTIQPFNSKTQVMAGHQILLPKPHAYQWSNGCQRNRNSYVHGIGNGINAASNFKWNKAGLTCLSYLKCWFLVVSGVLSFVSP